MINYYFNNQYDKENKYKPYTYKLDANDDTISPDNALRVAPIFKNGFWPCEKDGKWVLVEDNRKQTAYNIETKEAVTIDYLGEIKEGFTLLEPFEFSKWDGKKWALDEVAKTAATIKQNKLTKDKYINDATTKIETLTKVIEDATELDMPVLDIELQLKNWKKYRILLSQLNVSQSSVNWPEKPE